MTGHAVTIPRFCRRCKFKSAGIGQTGNVSKLELAPTLPVRRREPDNYRPTQIVIPRNRPGQFQESKPPHSFFEPTKQQRPTGRRPQSGSLVHGVSKNLWAGFELGPRENEPTRV